MTKVECPIQCGASNEPDAECCVGCGSPLHNHTRLTAYAAQLFNRGLVAARAGELSEARELFAAVVHWAPQDRKARNALALASFELGDEDRARHHWNRVLAQRPSDSFAATGLRRLDDAAPDPVDAPPDPADAPSPVFGEDPGEDGEADPGDREHDAGHEPAGQGEHESGGGEEDELDDEPGGVG